MSQQLLILCIYKWSNAVVNSPHLSYCRSPSPPVGRFCLFSVFECNWWLGKATAINVTRIRMNQDPLKIEIKCIQQEKERERIWRTCYLPSCCMRLWDQKSDKAGSMGHWPFYRLVICAAQWKWAFFHFNQPIQLDQIKFAGNFWDTMLALSFPELRLEMGPFWLEKARSCKWVVEPT